MCRAWENSMEQAKSEGKAEGIEQMANETAIGMLKENLSVDMIARVTKLTVEQVVEIGKKNALI